MASRKVLWSPGFGAGWTTWEHDPDVKRLMLTYQPIIEAIERGEDVASGTGGLDPDPDEAKYHPAVQRLIAECRAIGKEPPYLGGLRAVKVATVKGRVRIEEYDGSESLEQEGEFEGWL